MRVAWAPRLQRAGCEADLGVASYSYERTMRTVCDRGNPGSTQYSTAAGCRNSSFTILSSPADRARSRQGVVQSVRRPWLTGVQQGWRASPAHHLAGDALRRRRPSLWSNRRTAALTLSHRQRRLRAGLSFPAECTPAGVLVQPIVGAPLPTRPSSPAAGPTCGPSPRRSCGAPSIYVERSHD